MITDFWFVPYFLCSSAKYQAVLTSSSANAALHGEKFIVKITIIFVTKEQSLNNVAMMRIAIKT